MNLISLIIFTSLTVNIVNGHGQTIDPPSKPKCFSIIIIPNFIYLFFFKGRRELHYDFNKSYPHPWGLLKKPHIAASGFCGFYNRHYYNNGLLTSNCNFIYCYGSILSFKRRKVWYLWR